MAPTAKELNKLLNETKKATDSLYKVLDYVDLIDNNMDDLPADIRTWGSGIREHASKIEGYIDEIRNRLDTILNTIPVDPDEVKDAANKLLLYQGDPSQVMNWAEAQKRAYKDNSYWWRYWQAITDFIKEKKGQ